MLQKITTPKFLIGLLASFFVLSSEAAITISSVTNASETDLTATTPTIYGGLGGSLGAENGTNTLNNCTTATSPFVICNPARVYSALSLTISYTSSTTAGYALMTLSDGTALTRESGTTNTSSLSSGSTHSLVIKWDTLCDATDSSTSLTCVSLETLSSKTLTLNLGVDEDNDGTLEDSATIKIIIVSTNGYNAEADITVVGTNNGIDEFIAFPGDEKVFITPKRAEAFSFPTTPSESQFKYLRVMYSETSLAAINPLDSINSGTFSDLEVDLSDTTNTALKSSSVTGLKNNSTYFFRVALRDLGGNLAYFTDDNLYTTTNTATCNASAANAPTDIVNCPLTAFPDPVFGLMESDFNCFITTASFGSPLAPEVETFRAFRKTFLLPFSWGRTLNRWYYQVGPKAAQSIHNNHFLKSLSQAVLYPALWFAKASLSLGITATLLILLSSFAGFMLLTQRLRKTFARSL